MESRIRREKAPPWKSPAPGVRVRPLAEGDGTALMLYQIAPGTQFKPHAHPFPELGLIISGAGLMQIGGDERSVVGGDSYYVPGDVPHAFMVPADGEPVVLLDVSAAVGRNGSDSLQEMMLRLAAEYSAAVEATPRKSPHASRRDAPAGALPLSADSSKSRTPRPSH